VSCLGYTPGSQFMPHWLPLSTAGSSHADLVPKRYSPPRCPHDSHLTVLLSLVSMPRSDSEDISCVQVIFQRSASFTANCCTADSRLIVKSYKANRSAGRMHCIIFECNHIDVHHQPILSSSSFIHHTCPLQYRYSLAALLHPLPPIQQTSGHSSHVSSVQDS